MIWKDHRKELECGSFLAGPMTSSVSMAFCSGTRSSRLRISSSCASHTRRHCTETLSEETGTTTARPPRAAVRRCAPREPPFTFLLCDHFKTRCQERWGTSAFHFWFCFLSLWCPLSWLQLRFVLQETTGKGQSGGRWVNSYSRGGVWGEDEREIPFHHRSPCYFSGFYLTIPVPRMKDVV